MSSSIDNANAQALQPNYTLAANLAKRLKDAFVEVNVDPHWIEGEGHTRFWYRCNVSRDEFSFIYVDIEQRERRPAFDHERLAEALNAQGNKTSATALPFTWINLSCDGNVRFRIGEKKWQFKVDRTLDEFDDEIGEEVLKPMRRERPSESNRHSTAITFVNKTKASISLYWVDYAERTKLYATVEAGGSNTRPTYTGHVWRVTKVGTDESIASFVAGKSEAVAIVEEGMAPALNSDQAHSPLPEAGSESAEATDRPHRAFVKDYNVWARDKEGTEIQLSTSGTEENPFDEKLYLSVDSHFAVAYQFTPEEKRAMHLVESTPKDQLQPRLKSKQYLRPGDRVRIDRPRMFNLEEKREVPTEDSLFQNPIEIESMGWSADDREYRFLYNQRGHQILRVLGMDTQGNIRTIIEETSKTFIDYSHKQYFHELRTSNELIWASERDGRNHLYLFDLTGKLKNQITQGEWVVRSVSRVDEEKRQIWFTAFGVVKDQNPYYAQLIKVNFDGSGLSILTEGNGSHSWSCSPDQKYFIDTWSRVDLAPQTVVRNGETGYQIMALEEQSVEKLFETGWTVPERFAAPGRDGKTMIHGIIIKPADFDENKKYPLIEYIYAGPHEFCVPRSFSSRAREYELAALGFVVVMIDGMGTNWRSKAFHDYCYKNLKDAGLPDRIAWMKAASESRPWMDLEKVGIFGSSAGGQNALSALIWHDDFYKAAVADSGCHDNRLGELWWTEQWMGWPVDQSYEESSNVVHAWRLRGELMLTVGEMDTNVDPASTMQVVHALNKEERDYELLYMPGGTHGAATSHGYAIRRLQDFFVRHLMGVSPPKRNAESL